ncbi:MAG: response regulator transcription factor, partial [Acidimicrobiia bacterium]|nr:response regulator transcription factor [Acidimicrobiia bacterium]
MSRSARVLVVEDEPSFVEALSAGLRREGFALDVARDGREALDRFEACEPDVVLLDVMLPRLSGLDVCRAIRSRSNVPIIMVSAKGEEIDMVVGLEVGADDYVPKPYRFRELVARIRAVLRRVEVQASAGEAPAANDDGPIAGGEVSIDPRGHEVRVRGEAAHLPLK